MPVPQQLGRGHRMGRGPYEKSGLIEDTSLPPLRTVTSTYDIFFPFEEREEGEATVRTFPSETLEVLVQLWYLPFGSRDEESFLWHERKTTVTLPMKGK